jgi:hypothetical protein
MANQNISRETQLDAYARVVAANPAAELKGDTIPYTSVNGHMYSYYSKDNFLALRLPEKAKAEFLEKYNTTLVTAYGIVQKEYVTVPESLLLNTNELKPWFESSYAYVSSLKPKPAKNKK